MCSVTRRCVFYRTLAIDPSSPRGSDLRPAKLLAAFRNAGYEVDVVDGPAAARRKAIGRVVTGLRSGVEYDFVYAEPPTTPVALNEPNHLPLHPLMDHRFLAFCRSHGVPVILFYCDVQWRLPQYSRQVGRLKYLAALPFFHFDLAMYRRSVDVLLLPDVAMLQVLPRWVAELPHSASIPGFDPEEKAPRREGSRAGLRLFYVGGVRPPVYDLMPLLRGSAQARQRGVMHTLTICARAPEWRDRPESYNAYLGPHVEIVHNRTRSELLELYAGHDIAVMPYGTANSDWAMPVKFPEAIGMGLPVLAGEGTAVGRMAAEQRIGWVVGPSDGDFERVLREIDSTELQRARLAVAAVQPQYTWARRAQEIAELAGSIRADRERVTKPA